MPSNNNQMWERTNSRHPFLNDAFEKAMSAPPIDFEEKRFKKILEDTQANILRHHGNDYACYIFFSFKKDKESKAGKFISYLAKKSWFQSAYEQLDYRKKKSGKGNIRKLDINCFYLTFQGYEALGIEQHAPSEKISPAFRDSFYKRTPMDLRYKDQSFSIDSTETKTAEENDSGMPIHGLIMMTNDNLSELKKAVNEIIKKGLVDEDENNPHISLQEIAYITKNYAFLKRDNKNLGREWFGFVDGISHPMFFPEVEDDKYHNNSLSPLNTVLLKDKASGPYGAGSFLAFMKLEQDRMAFEEMVDQLSIKITKKLGDEVVPEETKELARAYLIGRFRNGTPVTLHKSESEKENLDNQFDYHNTFRKKDNIYSNDREGIRCPLHAHIRKANPRLENSEKDWHHKRIARRGMLYDDTKEISSNAKKWKDEPNKKGEYGMLFMSFQASIENQFEYIMENWLFSNKTNGKTTGKDPIIANKELYNPPLTYPTLWNNGTENEQDKVAVIFRKPCIKLRFGKYFYAPSLSFLENINRQVRNVNNPTVNTDTPSLNPRAGTSKEPGQIIDTYKLPKLIIKK